MNSKIYPQISEFVDAIKAPQRHIYSSFQLRPVLDENGEPIMIFGRNSVVFKMKDVYVSNDNVYAVKYFRKGHEGLKEVYEQISDYLRKYQSPYFVRMNYMDYESFDNTTFTITKFPVVVMDWVDGVNLKEYVKANINNRACLDMLLYDLSNMASWLIQQPFAHGSIKSDNIIIRENGSIVLIDYNNMFVPDMENQSSREMGNPNYIHPFRAKDEFNKHIDDFSLILILLALKSVIIDHSLIDKYGNEASFLFTESDLLNIGTSSLIKDIQNLLYDPELAKLYSAFMIAYSQKDLVSLNLDVLKIQLPDDCICKKIKELEKDKKYEEIVPLLKVLANHGDTLAQANLGAYYINGKGVEKNYSEGFSWISKSAKSKNSRGLRMLGSCYEVGIGTDKDLKKAFDLYSEAAEQGNYLALFRKGKLLLEGNGVERNVDEAFRIIKEAASYNYGRALYELALLYKSGIGTSINLDEYISCLKKSAEEKFPEAKGELGQLMYDGYLVSQDRETGKEYIEYAANNGVAKSMVKYAEILRNSKEYDYSDKVFQWYRKAARKGDPEGLVSLGYCYFWGIGCDSDEKLALSYFKQSSDKKHPRGDFWYGREVFESNDEESDSKKGMSLITRSASNGYYYAKLYLGKHFSDEDSFSFDLDKAIYWFTEACKDNKADAYYLLAQCYKKLEGESSEKYKKTIDEASAKKYTPALLECNLESDIITSKDYYADVFTYNDNNLHYTADGSNTLCYVNRDEDSNNYEIEDGTLVIVDKVFYDIDIDSVVIPSSVVVIGNNPFSCSTLNKLVCNSPHFVVKDQMLFDKDMKRLISYWGKRSTIELPEGLECIDDDVFFCHNELRAINFPKSLKRIGNGAFYGCAIKNINLPDSVEHVGRNCFSNCNELKFVSLSSSIREIPYALFAGCKNLSKVIFHPTTTLLKINDGAFDTCKLKNIILPDCLEDIGDYAFYFCTNLSEIIVPNSIRIIGRNAFSRNTKLVCKDNPLFFTDDNFIYKHENGISIISFFGNVKDVIIPSFVSRIKTSAFESTNIVSVDIPSSVKSIDAWAFWSCENLKRVKIQNGLEEIKDYAFRACRNLKEFIIPQTVHSLGHGCFTECRSLSTLINDAIDLTIPERIFSLDYSDYMTREDFTNYNTCYTEYHDISDITGYEDIDYPTLNIKVKAENLCILDGKPIDFHRIHVLTSK